MREAIITITNYGKPISDEDLVNIFQKFYRTDKSRTSPGTGLGLAIAKSIAEKHGGSIAAYCFEGKIIFELRFKTISDSL